jgi:hypothetical protein
MLPVARKENLIVRELPEQTLVFDHDRNKAHSLNRTAALVWRHCDGRTSTSDLAAILHRELDLPRDETVVHLALEQLSRRQLLATPLVDSGLHRQSRRNALKKLAIAAATLPVIMTMGAPSARAAVSITCKTPADCPPQSSNCIMATCTDGVCGTKSLANGTACNTMSGLVGTCNFGVCLATGTCTGTCTAHSGTCTGTGCTCPPSGDGPCITFG